MIDSIVGRLKIIRAKLLGDRFLFHSNWTDVMREASKYYGLQKSRIKRSAAIDGTHDGMLIVSIGERKIYWPASARLDRLADMYFEVYDEKNNHCYDIPDMRIREHDVVIDCGACEGYFTMKALEHNAGRVYCIEPGDTMFRCLSHTFSHEISSGRVSIHSCFLGNTNHSATYFENPADPTILTLMNATADDFGERSTGTLKKKDVIPLDKFVIDHSLSQVDFIKIDVEGSEIEVLEGARELLKKFRPSIAIAVYHKPSHANLVVDFVTLLNLNYRIKLKGIVVLDSIPRPVMVHCYQ